ncbi:hypothetical protein M2359_000475 [Gordonia amarae]|nr:hypothetical protein [Gordonia amarae]
MTRRKTSTSRWIAPRGGGYRPGGEFTPADPKSEHRNPTAPKGSAGVVTSGKKRT